jgi:ribosomal protein S18 acetylase RimI-like enzyme
MTIRAVERRDREALHDVVRNAGNFSDEEVATAMELIDDSLAKHNRGEYSTYVIEDEGNVRGYICLGPTALTAGTFDLYWIAVDRNTRGKRFGQRLLRFAEEEVQRRGGRLLLIETSSLPEYESSRRFYRRAGYPEVARIRNFYKPGDDKVIYAKELA